MNEQTSANQETRAGRIVWLDLARTLAIMGVVLVHSVEGIYSLKLEAVGHLSPQTTLFAFCAFTAGRVGLTFFLFMTGYLLLDRSYDRQGCIRFWKTRWLPLLACVEAWVVIYNVVLTLADKQPLSADYLLRTMLFLNMLDMGHFWYMPMILGLYLFLPLMAMALERLDVRTIAGPLALLCAFAFLAPLANQTVVSLGGEPFGVQLNLGYSGGAYGLYLLLGWCVKKGAFRKVPTGSLAGAAIALFVACVAFQLWCYAHGNAYSIWYTNGTLVACGLACFELLSRLEGKRIPAHGAVGIVAYYSFAIYLVHYPIRMFVRPHIKALSVMMPLRTLLLWAVVFFASLGLSWAISKIPRIGRPLLYLKERTPSAE